MIHKTAFVSHQLLLVTILLFSAPAYAVPILHQFFLEDAGGAAVYTGTVTVDSSRLAPNLFTPFSDPGFLSFSLTIGAESWSIADAYNPTTEGVFTDATGMIVSFVDSTIQSTILLLNSNNVRIDIVENNDSWSTDANAAVTLGPTHSFANVSAVPVPPALWLFGSGLLGLVGIARRRKNTTSYLTRKQQLRRPRFSLLGLFHHHH